MAAKVLDGKQVAANIRQEVAERLAGLRDRTGRTPRLVAVVATDDPAAVLYARSQERACAKVGIEFDMLRLPPDSEQSDLLEAIDRLNADGAVTGIIVCVPLPEGVDQLAVQSRITPHKDVEATGPHNLGLLLHRRAALLPCTPAAAVEMVRASGIDTTGLRAVVIGRSTVVGKPLALMLTDMHATVTVCHTRTKDLPSVCRSADLLVVAAGRPALVDARFVKPGAVVVDVGINQVEVTGPDGQKTAKTVGDVNFESVSQVAGAITPVPGGVGPVTVAMLLRNVLRCSELQWLGQG